MKRLVFILKVLLIVKNSFSQDTIHKQKFNLNHYKLCGTYISEDYNNRFYEYTGKIVGIGKIHEIICFSSDTNRVVFRPEGSENCNTTYTHLFKDSLYLSWYPWYGDYITSGDSIFIFKKYQKKNIVINKFDSTEIVNKVIFDDSKFDVTEYRELYYSGVIKSDTFTLKLIQTNKIYTKENPLVFRKCIDCIGVTTTEKKKPWWKIW